MMKALVLEGTKDLRIENIPVPTPKADEVLIHSKYAGICGTDFNLYNGLPGSADATPPIVLGHEVSGVVEKVGSHVKNVKAGDRVTVNPNSYCGKCIYCRTARPELCDHLSAVGVTRNGGLEQYFTAPSANVYPIPDKVSLKEAATSEPISCAVHAVRLLNLKPYQKALVIGDGFEGSIMAELLLLGGVHSVDMAGISDEKMNDVKHSMHLNKAINVLHQKITGHYDIVIEATGLPKSKEAAVHVANKGGQVVLFGVSKPHQKITLDPFKIYSKQLTIHGSFINPNTFTDSLALEASGQLIMNPLIRNIIKLEDVSDVLSGKKKPLGKCVVKID